MKNKTTPQFIVDAGRHHFNHTSPHQNLKQCVDRIRSILTGMGHFAETLIHVSREDVVFKMQHNSSAFSLISSVLHYKCIRFVILMEQEMKKSYFT